MLPVVLFHGGGADWPEDSLSALARSMSLTCEIIGTAKDGRAEPAIKMIVVVNEAVAPRDGSSFVISAPSVVDLGRGLVLQCE